MIFSSLILLRLPAHSTCYSALLPVRPHHALVYASGMSSQVMTRPRLARASVPASVSAGANGATGADAIDVAAGYVVWGTGCAGHCVILNIDCRHNGHVL